MAGNPDSTSPWSWLLAGPTASGKSEVALCLAERLGGEIISVDSMQVYRGLDLGTAKPGAADRARVPHHLIDVVELTQPFDAAAFVGLAREAVRAIASRGRVPILCGGTGLYFQAFLEGLGEAPATDAALRAELERTPLPELLTELAERDPATWAAMDRQNPRRVVRAVEVIRLTGRPFSEQRAAWPARGISESRERRPLFVLKRAPEDLRRRIDARVDAMFAHGLVGETEDLLARGLDQNRTAMQAIGYRQVVEHWRGERGLAETVALVKTRTWQFARRQLTWWRRQRGTVWIDVAPEETPVAVAGRMVGSLQ